MSLVCCGLLCSLRQPRSLFASFGFAFVLLPNLEEAFSPRLFPAAARQRFAWVARLPYCYLWSRNHDCARTPGDLVCASFFAESWFVFQTPSDGLHVRRRLDCVCIELLDGRRLVGG